MDIESKLKESIERGWRRGELAHVADDMLHFCTHYVDPFRVPLAMNNMLRLCHRFAQIAMEERSAVLKDEVAQAMNAARPFWRRHVTIAFYAGTASGCVLTLIIAAMVLLI